jgi:hypothetical protein
MGCLGNRLWCWPGREWRRFRGCGDLAGPDQPPPYIINDRGIGIQEGLFEILKIVVIKVELSLESAIRNTAQALEHRDGLRQDLLKCHYDPSVYLGALRSWSLVIYLSRTPEGTPCLAGAGV